MVPDKINFSTDCIHSIAFHWFWSSFRISNKSGGELNDLATFENKQMFNLYSLKIPYAEDWGILAYVCSVILLIQQNSSSQIKIRNFLENLFEPIQIV